MECLSELQQSQFYRYCELLAKTNCAREQRALLLAGPPVNLHDPNAFPEAGNDEIVGLWICKDQSWHSPKLLGSLEGEARLEFWEAQKQFRIIGEVADDGLDEDPSIPTPPHQSSQLP
eukprot:GHVT01012084.1.p1 GENE.GHVT01012084.1~~GHVT01012084.1.p1  ORF type:complete len:118 (-),score=18.89 GHVT01012084.1:638-991(-)